MKKNQIAQQTADNAKVLLVENIGSLLKTDLLTTMLVMQEMAKREMPRPKLLNEGKSKKVKKLIAMRHMAATAKRAFLLEGRKNIEE